MIKPAVLIFVTLSVIASALNYFIYPLLSRVLGPTEYVDITVALSLFTQVSTFMSSVIAITIGLSKSEDTNQANKKIEGLQAIVLRLFLVIAAVFLLFSPFIMKAINTPVLFAIPIVMMMMFAIPIQILSGYLNGKNMMAKLGLVIVLTATLQFTIGCIAAVITHSGLTTMMAMTISQVLGIVIIYSILNKDNLPNIFNSIKVPVSALRGREMRSLIIYTGVVSIGIMLINIVQVADLLILQRAGSEEAKFYADIYVISRAIFFAGTIFIWPFLGEVDINNHTHNRRPLVKIIGIFAVLSIIATLALIFFGSEITRLLFGVQYDTVRVSTIGGLSILFKLLMLVITAVVLYFTVLRKYIATILGVTASATIYIYSLFVGSNPDIATTLINLNIIATVFAAIAVVSVFILPIINRRVA